MNGMEPQRHGDTEKTFYYEEESTRKIIGCAIEVHRILGPGLLESVYEECLCRELHIQGFTIERQRPIPLTYKGTQLECVYRRDIVVNGRIVVELKCVEKIMPIHEAQLLTYLKLSNIKVGLIINFNISVLKDGIKRLVF